MQSKSKFTLQKTDDNVQHYEDFKPQKLIM